HRHVPQSRPFVGPIASESRTASATTPDRTKSHHLRRQRINSQRLGRRTHSRERYPARSGRRKPVHFGIFDHRGRLRDHTHPWADNLGTTRVPARSTVIVNPSPTRISPHLSVRASRARPSWSARGPDDVRVVAAEAGGRGTIGCRPDPGGH